MIPILQDAQEIYGYLPGEVLRLIARQLGMSLSKVYGVATFYSQFKLAKRGKYLLSLCRGTACHVKGSEKLLQYLYGLLGIRPGETTSDGKFTLQTVNCVGACAKAPNIMINNVVYGNLDEPKLKKLLEGLK